METGAEPTSLWQQTHDVPASTFGAALDEV